MPTEPADYTTIALNIIEQIRAGRLQPGDQLPSIAQLADQYETSKTTVKSAIIYLDGAGAIVRRQGKGIFVASRPRSTADEQPP